MLKGADLNLSVGQNDSGLGPADGRLSGASGANSAGPGVWTGFGALGGGHLYPTSDSLQALGSALKQRLRERAQRVPRRGAAEFSADIVCSRYARTGG
jgi:hypothetical protein